MSYVLKCPSSTSQMFPVARVLFYLLISQVPVNQICAYRVFAKDKHVHSASALRPFTDSGVSDVNFSRSVILDIFVAVDVSSYRYHGNDTKHYVMDMMNVAARLWQSTSLNINVTFRVVKFLILKGGQNDFEIRDHANLSLRNFCQWQKSVNAADDAGRNIHYDIAILITRLDIQIGGNYDATGVAYNRGLCDPQYRCAVCEDKSPMILAHTIAHEIGHLLGMRHDSDRNTCPDRVHIMSGYATPGPGAFTWSKCSRRALVDFLSSSRAECLMNSDMDRKMAGVTMDTGGMPGCTTYDADYQCKMLYGRQAEKCVEWNGAKRCARLKCRVTGSAACVTDGRPALPGTSCGTLKWCSGGLCVWRSLERPVEISETGQHRQGVDTPRTNKSPCNDCSTFPYMDTPAPAEYLIP